MVAKKVGALLLSLALLSGTAQATLFDRGGGLVYDDVLNVTWLGDANYAKTSGYDADGQMDWTVAMIWADNLSYYDSVRKVNYTDWRLPSIAPINGFWFNLNPYDWWFSTYPGVFDIGFNISAPGTMYAGGTGSELAYMFYNNLGNKGYFGLDGIAPQPGWDSINTSFFTNLQRAPYWAGTEYPYPDYAFVFEMMDGYQLGIPKNANHYAWAVRDGDVIATSMPEPSMVSLIVLGLLGAFQLRRRQQH